MLNLLGITALVLEPPYSTRGMAGKGGGGDYGFILSEYGNNQRNKSQYNHTAKEGEQHGEIFQRAKDQGDYSLEESNLKYYEE